VSGGGRTVPPVSKPGLPDLTAAEREALVAAGAWYAKYHASDIAADAGDSSIAAVTERARYEALLAALDKLGVKVALPDELTGWGATLAA
jgi:hypothetical protein